MDAIALHLELRNALSLSDELGRHEHALGNDTLAGHLASIRTSLGELERDVGRSHEAHVSAKPTVVERIERALQFLRDRLEEIPVALRPRLGQLMSSLERIVFAELRPSAPVPAKPVLGVLPLARVIPQDVHSVMDYLVTAAYLVSAGLAKTPRARAAGIFLAANVGTVSMLTDYRLSLAKVIPIEVHEVLDHVSGSGAVAAPFVLGYRKRDPIASAIQIATGIGTILASLFTDYRAQQGVGRAMRSRGGPRTRRFGRRRRVPEVQRPLEGFANPSVLPRLHF
ncbi:MAG TPA: hypothetical protein VM925_30665 [Labilithrix sp.]|nr:hypothetical protein [Labilithrix sp.]